MSQCKVYTQKDIKPDIYQGTILINCATCKTWTGERCGDEAVALNMNDTELVEGLKLCDW